MLGFRNSMYTLLYNLMVGFAAKEYNTECTNRKDGMKEITVRAILIVWLRKRRSCHCGTVMPRHHDIIKQGLESKWSVDHRGAAGSFHSSTDEDVSRYGTKTTCLSSSFWNLWQNVESLSKKRGLLLITVRFAQGCQCLQRGDWWKSFDCTMSIYSTYSLSSYMSSKFVPSNLNVLK